MLVGLGTLASLGTFAMSLGVGRSDAAGNGLAQAYVVVAFLATTLLTVAALLCALAFDPPAGPAAWTTTLGLAGLAGIQPVTTLPPLFATRNGAFVRTTVAIGAIVGQLAIGLHVLWRALGLAVPAAVAVGGVATVAALTTVSPILAWPRKPRRRADGVFAIAFPALALRPGEAVRVVRDLDELTALGAAFLTAAPAATTIDAHGTAWTLQPAATLADWRATRAAHAVPIADVQTQLLALPSLHPDPATDATVRHLVAMQRDIAALACVLPRPRADG